MVIGQSVECLICSSDFFIRVGIGLDSYQKHYFDCLNCEQPIGIAVRSNGSIETIENCKLGGLEIDNSKTIINLHPSFCFPVEKYHDIKFFPSLEGVALLSPYIRQRKGAFLQDVATQFDIPNADSIWGTVKAIYNLSYVKGKEKALVKTIKSYNLIRKKLKSFIVNAIHILMYYSNFTIHYFIRELMNYMTQ